MPGGLQIVRVSNRAKRAERMARDARDAYLRSNPELRLFQLTEDLNASGHATPYAYCNPCVWNPSTQTWGVDTTIQLHMLETLGLYYGLSGEKLWGSMTAIGDDPSVARTAVIARSHGAPTHEGKLDGSLAAAGTATFSIWTKASGSWADSTVNVTINAPPRLSSGSIATGKWGRIYYELTAPGWTLDSAEC